MGSINLSPDHTDELIDESLETLRICLNIYDVLELVSFSLSLVTMSLMKESKFPGNLRNNFFQTALVLLEKNLFLKSLFSLEAKTTLCHHYYHLILLRNF